MALSSAAAAGPMARAAASPLPGASAASPLPGASAASPLPGASAASPLPGASAASLLPGASAAPLLRPASSLDLSELRAFLQRIAGDKASSFEVAWIPPEHGKDVFELEQRRSKIILKGNNGLSVASALQYYLRNYCHCLITWGEHPALPSVLPPVSQRVHRVTPYTYRYYLNYCTFNYSMAWWDWNRWQQEIDWMALNGINMPLALTGEEAIWDEVYTDMGFTREELDRFFCGPAYFSWFWMGNIDAWGGPLPAHWMVTHKALQQKILQAERSMGMTPVLPAFTGHVPPSFASRFPGAKVKKTNWGAGFDDVCILDPSDPLFESIGRKFIETQTRAYGTDHLYSADSFNENVPPTNDSAYLSAMSKKVYASMAGADPAAVWVMQGWMFHYNASFWGQPQIQALLRAVPDDQMILLDLYSESHPVWNRTDAYYGKPWIWNMLHNFGGNISLWGRMSAVAGGPHAAGSGASAASGKMAGIGLTMEGIEQNPALYQLMLDNVWTDSAIDLHAWLDAYALQRYGQYNEQARRAWHLLDSTVYDGGLGEGGPESIIVARPTTDVWADRVRTKLDYKPRDLVRAWSMLVAASDSLGANDAFQYDLVDVTRQVLANYATPLQQKWVLAYLQHDLSAFDRYSDAFIALMSDMDSLLSTRKEFLLGRWIGDARRCGADTAEANLYEKNARDLITLWGDKESGLHEYSCRQWSGLIWSFYLPRWAWYFADVRGKIITGARMETDDVDRRIRDWEWNWVNAHDITYPEKPSGDPVAVVKALYKKYVPLVDQ
ncbi:alpha-N-acetylglucosaminidase [Dinghuibacter silviterrae]|uniref:alpha-N-acetylglucosaminidase n=1 Tax=Dinghuibacter silviterrae TaxID=1539049 RepID=UPI001FE39CC1|nr:alpha-N-acetylglucosaminidase [Dinghuibacter silviterrae]